MSENIKKGGIAVETENIFPIIKRWLYSEKDIFLREIVSNATDAITKLKRLQSLGQIPTRDEKYQIKIILDKDEKTITVKDNGIGMTEEELERYICQIALSGAVDFIQKYEQNDASSSGIIGHFGLGFYSAFMVSETVEVIAKSYTDAPAVHWTCSDVGTYEMEKSDITNHGTAVIMHVSSEEEEYLNETKLRSMLDKYCSFMPVDIYFEVKGEEKEDNLPINDTTPLWQKNPSECTAEEYNTFYKKVFSDYRDPLFYIHINADYPLNFKGILFFPKINSEYDSIEGQVKLYYNQVFVADNIKEVIPDYLLMLKGVLDCPELPLNVSRSYLQTNTYVSKLSSHIVKKVADKLNSLCNTNREEYQKVWNDIKIFVEYACMRDKKFYDRIQDSLLLELTDNTFVTLSEYLEKTSEKTVYYTSDKALQAQYISLFQAEGIQIACFEKNFESQFLAYMEQYNDTVKFVRVDADIAAAIKSEENASEDLAVANLFKEVCGNKDLSIRFETLKSDKIPAVLNISEEARRFDDMMKMYAPENNNAGLSAATLVVNMSSPLIKKIQTAITEDKDLAKKLAKQIFSLSVLSQRKLSAEEMQEFLADSFSILEDLT